MFCRLAGITLALAAATAGSGVERARALIDSGQLEQARAMLEKTIGDPALAGESLVLLTRICNLEEDHERGVAYGERAVKLLPSSSEAHFRYAVALRQRMSNSGKLKAMTLVGTYKDELARALLLDGGNLDAREEEIGFLLNAPGVAGGDIDKAKVKIGQLKELDWRRGTVLEVAMLRQGDDTEGAIALLKALLARFPEDHASRISLGLCLQQAKRFAEADEQLKPLLAVDDASIALSATYQLARSRVLGRYEQERAIGLLGDYLARFSEGVPGLPSKSAALWRMGQAHEQLRQLGEARECFEKAIALDGGNEEAKKSLKALPKG